MEGPQSKIQSHFSIKFLGLLLVQGLFIFQGCKDNDKIVTHYPSGAVASKLLTDDNGMPNGTYEEFFESGELKSTTIYRNGKLNDSLYLFNVDGDLYAKGILVEGQKNGWWKFYDNNGKTDRLEEYVMKDSMGEAFAYKNQVKYFKDEKVDYSKSYFFDIQLEDTLKLGKNIGLLKNYSSYNSDVKHLYVTIDNKYGKDEILKETFSGEKNQTKFGVYAYQTGPMKIKGTVEERLISVDTVELDSSNLKIKTITRYFEHEAYVRDTIEK